MRPTRAANVMGLLGKDLEPDMVSCSAVEGKLTGTAALATSQTEVKELNGILRAGDQHVGALREVLGLHARLAALQE